MGIGKIYAYFSPAIPYNIPEAYKLNCLIVLSFKSRLKRQMETDRGTQPAAYHNKF